MILLRQTSHPASADRPETPKRRRYERSERGVALIITIIMLTVITFLAIAFLAISRRERNSVNTTVEQTDARLAADVARERAIVDMVAGIITHSNLSALGPAVSKAYQNPNGFQPGIVDPTNVNYDFLAGTVNHDPLTTADRTENIGNLQFDPTPPVVISNRVTGATDFRFFLDLDRNGVFDPGGLQPVLGTNGNYLDTNGVASIPTNIFPLPVDTLTNWFLGDPVWVGLLEHPEFPHSSSNFVKSRYAYLVLPYGLTLDINSMHNQAFTKDANVSPPAFDRGFRRNQGFGTWEINLAAFFYDLNTNLFAWGGPLGYTYDPFASTPQIKGTSFDDALEVLRYRYANDYTSLRSVSQLYGAQAALAFRSDGIDGYSDLPFVADLSDLDETLPGNQDNAAQPWVGDSNTNRIFSAQAFFDPKKVGPNLPNKLTMAGAQPDAYNRNTFSRLISQLGTESEPDSEDRINLNYDNLVSTNPITGAVSATNFYTWEPVALFTNIANRMLERAGYTNFVTSNSLTTADIPLYPINHYTPGVNRILQLAANIVDATTNRYVIPGIGNRRVAVPSVFKPIFASTNSGEEISIVGYQELKNFGGMVQTNSLLQRPKDLLVEADRIALQPTNNVYGIPLIFGAKKGLPNFNEYSMQTIAGVTRRLELQRPNNTSLPNQTNQMYVVSVENHVGLEAWNSYATNFPLDVDLIVANDITMLLTNESPSDSTLRVLTTNAVGSMTVLAASNPWQAFQFAPGTPSFRIPMTNTFNFINNAIWRTTAPTGLIEGFDLGFERTGTFPVPDFSLYVTNRLRFFMVEKTTGRFLDYIQLNDLDAERSISSELLGGADAQVALWRTNRVPETSVSIASPTEGIVNQINISLGNPVPGFPAEGEWNDYGLNQATGFSKKKAIDEFRVFFGLSPIYFPGNHYEPTNRIQAPFTPTRRMYQYQSWQANDPLVHFLASDLQDLRKTNTVDYINPPSSDPEILPNLGKINDRYKPWPIDRTAKPEEFDLAKKDPLVTRSDDWDFPTNKFPNIGWLGKVHRGTPWQTMYLKSTDVANDAWARWTGNDKAIIVTNGSPTNVTIVSDVGFTKPFMDHDLLDLFTVAMGDNATRGQLSVNQTNLASWSAVLSGMIPLTNTVPDTDLANAPGPLIQTDPATNSFTGNVGIEPVGTDGTNSPLWRIYDGINRTRADTNLFPNRTFLHMGEVLRTPEFTVASPYLNLSEVQKRRGISDEMYERIPQLVLSLLKTGDPRFVVYAYGQSLKPADRSIVQSGPYFGMCTNYQITGEVVTRTIVRIDGTPENPRAVVEKYNVLQPE